MTKTNSQPICKNVFKDGRTITSKEDLTKAWIHLINQLEKTRSRNTETQKTANLEVSKL